MSKCAREESLLSIDDEESVDIRNRKGEDAPGEEKREDLYDRFILKIGISSRSDDTQQEDEGDSESAIFRYQSIE